MFHEESDFLNFFHVFERNLFGKLLSKLRTIDNELLLCEDANSSRVQMDDDNFCL